jgi:hypothetical protein
MLWFARTKEKQRRAASALTRSIADANATTSVSEGNREPPSAA